MSFLIATGLVSVFPAFADAPITLLETEPFYNLSWTQMYLSSASDSALRLNKLRDACGSVDLANRYLDNVLSDSVKASGTLPPDGDVIGSFKIPKRPELEGRLSWKDEAAKKEANGILIGLRAILPDMIKNCYLAVSDRSLFGVIYMGRFQFSLGQALKDSKRAVKLISENAEVKAENDPRVSASQTKKVSPATSVASDAQGASSNSNSSGAARAR